MEEIKNFIYSHSSPNGCVALTRGERDELVIMVEALEEDNLNKQELINDYVFENAKLTKENERLSKMLEMAMADNFNVIFANTHTIEELKESYPWEDYRAELEKRVENIK